MPLETYVCMYHDYYNDPHNMIFLEQKDLVPFVNILALFTISVMNKTTIFNLPQ
jgi:hypothetical protein